MVLLLQECNGDSMESAITVKGKAIFLPLPRQQPPLRYLVQDDPFTPKATDIIERRLTEETPGFVSIVAM